VRPSQLDHTYAFPSGHTTAAVFFLGALLYIILPLCAAGVKTPCVRCLEAAPAASCPGILWQAGGEAKCLPAWPKKKLCIWQKLASGTYMPPSQS
jgi:hypothetical protein